MTLSIWYTSPICVYLLKKVIYTMLQQDQVSFHVNLSIPLVN